MPGCGASQTIPYTQPLGARQSADSDPGSPAWGLRRCISNELPADAAAGPEVTLGRRAGPTVLGPRNWAELRGAELE